jgi:hypothetical protein
MTISEIEQWFGEWIRTLEDIYKQERNKQEVIKEQCRRNNNNGNTNNE